MKKQEHDADYYIQLLSNRRARLGRLITLEAPDIIILHAMKMVARSQREVYGRHWDKASLRERISIWWATR